MGLRHASTEMCVKERPNFGPRQIRTPRGLKLGRMIIEFKEGHGPWKLFKVVSLPEKKGAGWIIKVSNSLWEEEKSLQDHNIFPYKSGLWNPEWCFLRTGAKTKKGLHRTTQKNLLRR